MSMVIWCDHLWPFWPFKQKDRKDRKGTEWLSAVKNFGELAEMEWVCYMFGILHCHTYEFIKGEYYAKDF